MKSNDKTKNLMQERQSLVIFSILDTSQYKTKITGKKSSCTQNGEQFRGIAEHAIAPRPNAAGEKEITNKLSRQREGKAHA